jgi:hypothetical protein
LFQIKVEKKIRQHILTSKTFIQKSWLLWDNTCMKKYGRAGQATDGSMVHAHCVLEDN